MRETLYSPPGGEGPSVVAGCSCVTCNYLDVTMSVFRFRYHCIHPDAEKDYRPRELEHSSITPSWCPIVSADPEVWQKRMKGEGE